MLVTPEMPRNAVLKTVRRSANALRTAARTASAPKSAARMNVVRRRAKKNAALRNAQKSAPVPNPTVTLKTKSVSVCLSCIIYSWFSSFFLGFRAIYHTMLIQWELLYLRGEKLTIQNKRPEAHQCLLRNNMHTQDAYTIYYILY